MINAIIHDLVQNFERFRQLVTDLAEHGPDEPLTEFRLSFENIVLAQSALLAELRRLMEKQGVESVAYKVLPIDIVMTVRSCLYGEEVAT